MIPGLLLVHGKDTYLMRHKKIVALDTETTGISVVHGHQPYALSLCDEEGITYYWEWKVNPFTRKVCIPESDVSHIIKTLKKYRGVVIHNAKFDVKVCDSIGISLIEIFGQENIECTLLMSHVLDSGELHGAKRLAVKYLGFDDEDEKELHRATLKARSIGRQRGWKLAPDDCIPWDNWMPKAVNSGNKLCETYCVKDSERAMLLYLRFKKMLEEQKLVANYEREKKVLWVVNGMEHAGVPLRTRVLSRVINETTTRADYTLVSMRRFAHSIGLPDFNPNSQKQLSDLLYEKLKLPVFGWTKSEDSKPSTDKDTLALLTAHLDANPTLSRNGKLFVEWLLKYRKDTKALTALTQYQSLAVAGGPGSLEEETRLYPSFHQCGTDEGNVRTTRFSSSDPNAQNVEKGEGGLRRTFGPVRGTFWLDIDYNQLELRLLAKASGCFNMQEAFDKDEDIHQWTADLCQIARKPAKNANYAIVYGAGFDKLALMTGIGDMGELFKAAYPEVVSFMQENIRQARKFGYVYTAQGYRLSVDTNRAYIATNYVIQGTAGIILKDAMIGVEEVLARYRMNRHYAPLPRILMPIHDELVIECPEELRGNAGFYNEVKKAMEFAGSNWGFHTPVDVSEVTTSWDSPKPWKPAKVNKK